MHSVPGSFAAPIDHLLPSVAGRSDQVTTREVFTYRERDVTGSHSLAYKKNPGLCRTFQDPKTFARTRSPEMLNYRHSYLLCIYSVAVKSIAKRSSPVPKKLFGYHIAGILHTFISHGVLYIKGM